MEKPIRTPRGGGTLRHPDMKYTLDELKEIVPNPARLAAIEGAIGIYDQPHANSLAEHIVSMSRYEQAKARKIDEFLGFITRGDISSFLVRVPAWSAGRQAAVLQDLDSRDDGERILPAVMQAALATADPRRPEERRHSDVAVLESLGAISERFAGGDVAIAACATFSKYRGASAQLVAEHAVAFMKDRRRSAESTSAFLSLFDSQGMVKFIDVYGRYESSRELLDNLTKHARQRLHRKDLRSALESESAYVESLTSRMLDDAVVGAVRKFDRPQNDEDYPYGHSGYNTIYKTLYRMAQSSQASVPMLEFANAITAFDPKTAEDVNRMFLNVWDRMSGHGKEKTAVADTEITRLISLASKGGMDFPKSFDTDTIVDMLRSGLDGVVKDRKTFGIVGTYLESDGILPIPTAGNIATYEDIANGLLGKRYGLEKRLTIDQIELLFSFDNYRGGQEAMRQGAVHFVNVSREENARFYSINQGSSPAPVDYTREQLARYSVLAILGSKSEGAAAEAAIARIVGAKAIAAARNEFNARHRRLMPELIAAVQASDYGRAAGILAGTKEEHIADVLAAVDYKDVDVGNPRLMKAVESKNPLDYDSRLQIACVYLPQGAHIFEYCTDERIALVRYDMGGRSVGSAICYMEDGVFLVDSVEGHRTFRKPEVYEAVYNDLLDRARSKGARTVVFSTDASNETPSGFEQYIAKAKGLRKSEVKMKLNTPAYLEADEDGVSGMVVDLSTPDRQAAAGIGGVLRRE